ncbi:uncharacterized protein OCT59_026738 [Rhizophagus irregularis]|uniref:uncharacterized protein n=1 Tax=Rhizophagus irregularis TaxID=588596 RepID=UPI0019FCA8E6|nr:hypothetical protein OCT59_026738 [Rhizophagus irregularis]GBC16400.2 hypothetical protein RIR_jg32259.t1 [Rhizophagus irregularis DAOM 181602=DAOM 197198]
MYISDCTIPPEFWYSKVNLLATYIRTVFKTICIPSSNVFIDEMIARFSGRSAHIVRIKNKPTPKGYKILSFCDAGYTYIFIFTSRIQIYPEIQQVSDLRACGTVRTNSANFPKVLKANKKLDWNTLSGVVVNNVLAILWMDNGSVMMLSTIHQIDNENENQIERDFRLQIVWDLIEESLKESEKKLHIRNQVDELINQFKFIYVDPQYVTAKYELPIIRLFPEDHYPEWRETKSSCV